MSSAGKQVQRKAKRWSTGLGVQRQVHALHLNLHGPLFSHSSQALSSLVGGFFRFISMIAKAVIAQSNNALVLDLHAWLQTREIQAGLIVVINAINPRLDRINQDVGFSATSEDALQRLGSLHLLSTDGRDLNSFLTGLFRFPSHSLCCGLLVRLCESTGKERRQLM